MLAKSAIVACFAAFAAAQIHAPVGEPSGNAIVKPALGDVVTAGEPVEIVWEPSTPNTVSLLFLIDAPLNAHKAGPSIAEGIANTGSFLWTPPAEFGEGKLGFGIQLIDDKTGQYQYSVNFGLEIPDDYEVPSSTPAGYPTATPSSTKDAYPSSTANSTTPAPTSASKTSTKIYVSSTGAPLSNTTVIQPTKPITVPSSLKTTATGTPSEEPTSPPQQSENAATQLHAGAAAFIGFAGLFFML